jgi:hypothetical protein
LQVTKTGYQTPKRSNYLSAISLYRDAKIPRV